ncbi:MAG: 7-carboxy-7-deazaguanine synthase QueE [Bacteroidia bacterium]
MDKLPVMEHFYTIQGEGAYTGNAAYFIRLGGCDVGCVWCDVKESWDASKHPLISVDDIVGYVLNTNAKLAVITGGEPCMHQLDLLTEKLIKNNIKINIETSGAYEITGNWNWICVSPKKFKAPLLTSLNLANELKVIIYNKSDFDWAEKHAELVQPNCKFFLQPEWDKKEEMLPLIIDYVKQNPKWQISLQTHKYMNIP